ncbi:hypothetical protein MalM25_20010 [Planctomycetes bacterium MalM25]|nr:hypothetical protein MalM25_20010 [Planctomycetes bacterium MalM25]
MLSAPTASSVPEAGVDSSIVLRQVSHIALITQTDSKNMTARSFFTTLLLVPLTCGSASAIETVIINGTTGNGDFEATEDPGDPGVLSGPQQYIDTPNWFNASGSEGINFTNDSQTGGSSQGGSRAGMPFMSRVQINNTGYTIGSEGEAFNVSYDFGAGGNPANWDGDEVMRTFLFTSTVPVDGFLDASTDITSLGEDLYPIDLVNDGQWTTRNAPAFYSSTAGDVGSTVYFGMEFLNPGGNNLFPRLDVVRFTTGAPEPFLFEFDAGHNPTDGTTTWEPNIDQGPQTGGLPTEFFTFSEAASATPVNDPSVPGITASYSSGGSGRDTNISAGASGEQPSAFEVWFKPDSLAGGEQVIAEFGGGLNGSYLSLDDDGLAFYSTSSQGGGGNATVSTTLTDAEWTQVVANWDGDAGEYELFVNGASVDSLTGDAIVRFAGGNQWGLGQVGGDTGDDLAVGGPLSTPATLGGLPLAGEIGLFRYYDSTLTAQEVADAFAAIAAVPGTLAGDYNEDGVVDAADYSVWRDNEGQPAGTLPNDVDGGVIGQDQYDTWASNYGATSASLAVAVPEPTAVSGCLLLISFGASRSRRG